MIGERRVVRTIVNEGSSEGLPEERLGLTYAGARKFDVVQFVVFVHVGVVICAWTRGEASVREL